MTCEFRCRLPRRDLVWTLQILLWWPETWETAAAGLYTLAKHENETWSNNATGEFASAFAMYLSGSMVPYTARAAWLERMIARARPEQFELLTNAAAAGLSGHHFGQALASAAEASRQTGSPRRPTSTLRVDARLGDFCSFYVTGPRPRVKSSPNGSPRYFESPTAQRSLTTSTVTFAPDNGLYRSAPI